jgi:hypothetical protein
MLEASLENELPLDDDSTTDSTERCLEILLGLLEIQITNAVKDSGICRSPDAAVMALRSSRAVLQLRQFFEDITFSKHASHHAESAIANATSGCFLRIDRQAACHLGYLHKR